MTSLLNQANVPFSNDPSSIDPPAASHNRKPEDGGACSGEVVRLWTLLSSSPLKLLDFERFSVQSSVREVEL